MALDCFFPQGLTKLIACTTTPSTAISLDIRTQMVRVHADTVIHLAFGCSTGSSGIVATMPTTSTPANGIRMASDSVEVFSIGPGAYLSFISSGGSGTVTATPGYGI
jgi:hypothetical protein